MRQEGKGNHWTSATRLLLVHTVVNLQVSDVQSVIERVFAGQNPNPAWVQRRMNEILIMDAAGLDNYILGPDKRGGNEKKLCHDEIAELLAMRRVGNHMRGWQLEQEFNSRYPYPQLEGVSRRTVARYTHHACITCKEASVKSLGADAVAQLQWLDDMSRIDPLYIIDIDENSCSRSKLVNTKAYATEGDRANRMQIPLVMLGYSFSIISAYTPFGFVSWRIHTGTITSSEVLDFIEQDVAPALVPENFVILDNAANHGTLPVRRALEHVTQGNWDYSASYSYEYKPCEKGLSMVVTEIRSRVHECQTLQDCIDLIHASFELYSIRGERGHLAFNHFRHLMKNHLVYKDENNL
jgi:hypothetical protein